MRIEVTTVIFAGLAVIASLFGVYETARNHREQRDWQERQEESRRVWERAQESSRRSWELAREVSLRWDEMKQAQYATFLSLVDRLISLNEELVGIRRDLSEDLAGHLHTVEDYYASPEGRLRLDAMDEAERTAFWESLYERERESIEKRQQEALTKRSSLQREAAKSLANMELTAPPAVIAAAQELSEVETGSRFGYSYPDSDQFEGARSEYLREARRDLQIPRDSASSVE